MSIVNVKENIPFLPELVVTLDGAEFDPRSDHWSIRVGAKRLSIRFDRLEYFDDRMTLYVKAVLIWYFENKSISHAGGMFERLLHFGKAIGPTSGGVIQIINVATILNYRNSLSPTTAWYLASLAGFLKKWTDLGWPGVAPEVVSLLNEMRLRGNRKGEAVRTMDPVKGPLTDIERQAVIDALNNGRVAGEISHEDQLLGLLLIVLGPRPIQVASLKICDFLASTDESGRSAFVLRVPRAKQRGAVARQEFKDRVLGPDIGKMVQTQIEDVRLRLAEMVPDIEQAPLFPAKMLGKGWLKGFEWHQTTTLISGRITRVLDALDVRSERTGKALHITPQRLRRTLATHAAIEGHGELVIADLLDQSDTQNAGVYVEANPEIVDRIDKALAFRMAPLAQAFAGVLKPDASPKNVAKPIIDRRAKDGNQCAGGCGKHGFCGLAAPIACYTCVEFTAWADGPHEEILDRLLADRQRFMEQGSARIASVNDRTILAVAEVVRLCAESRAAQPETANG